MIQTDAADQYSLRGRVFHEIRESILSGKYKQQSELKENALAEELGVSRTPVREALRQLELEGLVQIVPNKGARVVGIGLQDVKDIYLMRAQLEGICAQLAAKRITASELEAMEEIAYLTDFHVKKKNYEQLFELDNRFHEILYEASGSRMMMHVLKDFHHYVERVRKFSLSDERRSQQFNEEHKAILAALSAKDEERAKELAHLHMANTIQNLEGVGIEKILSE